MLLPELFVGGFFPIVAGIYVSWQYDVNVAVVGAALGALWFGSKAFLRVADRPEQESFGVIRMKQRNTFLIWTKFRDGSR